MASPIQTAAVLFLVLSGVKAADKELGEICTDAGSCVHPTLGLVCDVVAKKCMIKHGQSCAGDGHGDLCVAGADCSSGTCTCKTSVYSEDTATGKCTATTAKWSSICPFKDDCTGDSLQCTTEVCVCVANKQVELSTGLCSVAVDTSKVGKECTTAGEDTTNCGTQSSTHLECPANGGTCVCQTGFTGSIGGGCTAVSGTKVGVACTSGGSECGTQATTHLTCPSANCACESGYYGVPGGDCYPAKGKLDGGCSGSGQGTCEDANAECTGSPAKKCSCKSGYQAASGSCAIADNKYGGSCTTTTAVTRGTCEDENALCSAKTGGTCSCKTGFSGTDGAGCTILPGKYGGSCTADTANTKGTCEDANAQCSATTGGTCSCKTGYSGTDGAGCSACLDHNGARTCASVCLCLSRSGIWCGRRKYGLFHDSSHQILSSDQAPN